MPLSLVTISCGDDEANDEYEEGDGKTETVINTEYTAMTKVKEAKLEKRNFDNAYYVVYMDFNYKYVLNLRAGYLALEPYSRHEGKWKIDFRYGNSGNSLLSNNYLADIKDLGKLNGIVDIMEKIQP